MNDDDLTRLLRAAVPPVAPLEPSRNLWPAVITRGRTPVNRVWLDVGLAALITVALILYPDWLWLLAYHF